MSANPGFLPKNITAQLGVSQVFGVTDLTKGGPAEKAGIKRGDIIFKIDSSFVTDPAASVSQIINVSPGQPIELSILRQDQESAENVSEQLRDLGIIVRHFKQPRIEDFLRITVGTEMQNRQLITGLVGLLK